MRAKCSKAARSVAAWNSPSAVSFAAVMRARRLRPRTKGVAAERAAAKRKDIAAIL
jgi:hypothetical protein